MHCCSGAQLAGRKVEGSQPRLPSKRLANAPYFAYRSRHFTSASEPGLRQCIKQPSRQGLLDDHSGKPRISCPHIVHVSLFPVCIRPYSELHLEMAKRRVRGNAVARHDEAHDQRHVT